ncbi:MAG: UDP-2,3-diacylglucosamine diphosphatase [Marinifilaceae bacterium]|nr:UDP-2,3-diacylglucosamine diphosphatase [Marinifilaceae bacterium]
MSNKSIYFLSDVHLGSRSLNNDRERELHLITFIDSIKEHCASLWLMGDIFDFWFEYKHAVPKGHTRLLGKLSELTDQGIEVHIFTGNHDIWMFGYLEQECGVRIHTNITELITLNNKTLLLGHGDGLNPKDIGFKIIRTVFHSKFAQWLFRIIHPDCGIALARKWSSHSRKAQGGVTQYQYSGDNHEDSVIFSNEYVTLHPEVDYVIFGHRHLPFEVILKNGATYINLGDWLTQFTYAELTTSGELFLKKFPMA